MTSRPGVGRRPGLATVLSACRLSRLADVKSCVRTACIQAPPMQPSSAPPGLCGPRCLCRWHDRGEAAARRQCCTWRRGWAGAPPTRTSSASSPPPRSEPARPALPPGGRRQSGGPLLPVAARRPSGVWGGGTLRRWGEGFRRSRVLGGVTSCRLQPRAGCSVHCALLARPRPGPVSRRRDRG